MKQDHAIGLVKHRLEMAQNTDVGIALTARSWFGITELKAQQLQVIKCVCDGNNVVAVLPTGFGKSLCYQVAAVKLYGFAIVISPLLALCSDQIGYLSSKFVPVARFDSSMKRDEQKAVLEEVVRRPTELKVLFTTPESLQRSNSLMKALRTANIQGSVSCVVVDEAHCVESWCSFR